MAQFLMAQSPTYHVIHQLTSQLMLGIRQAPQDANLALAELQGMEPSHHVARGAKCCVSHSCSSMPHVSYH
jgi:hypothetical protein